MQISVTFKHIDASEPLKTYVSEKLDRFDKYLYNPAEANVVLSVEKFRHIADVNIVGDGLTIKGKEETEDMYSAIDMVLDKLEKQIKKSKEKQRSRRAAGPRTRSGGAAAPVDRGAPPNVHLENIEYKPMDIEEAILQMGSSQIRT